jgi:predicted DNA-binding transcriptional regulator
MERLKPLLRRRTRAYLVEFLEKEYTHSRLDSIIDKLELDESLKGVSPKSRKAEEIIERVLYNPHLLLEFLNIVFKNRSLDNRIQEIKRELELSGITFIEEREDLLGITAKKVREVVFIGYDIQIQKQTTEKIF